MIQKVNFSQNTTRIFADVLAGLKEACYPALERISPSIQIKKPQTQICSDYGVYTIKELNNSVKSKQILPSHIGCIKINGVNWFFKEDDPFDFYSEKDNVILEFSPQRLINPKILKDKSVLNCIKKMLALISQQNVSSQKLLTVFPEKVCRKVYELSPPREYILSSLTIAIERVRRTLFQHLQTHHETDIRKLPDFQTFQKNQTNTANVLIQFLKKDYKGFILAEKWGYIKNSKKLISFQKLRDIPRHTSKFMPSPLESDEVLESMNDEDWNRWIYHGGYPYQNPSKLYDAFQKALFFTKPKASQDTVLFDDATLSIWAQKDIEKFKKILNSLPNRNKLEVFIKKNFPEEVSTENIIIEKSDKTQVVEPITVFSSFYIRGKGVASDKDKIEQPNGSGLIREEDFHNWDKLSNTCAHANENYQESAKILSDDYLTLSEFVEKLQAALDRKYQSQITTRRVGQSR